MTLTAQDLNILRMLRRSAEPLSGRQIAEIAGIAPNTANRLLKALRELDLVHSSRDGRAIRWTTTAAAGELQEFSGSTQERIALVVTAVELEHTEVRNRLLNSERVRVGGIWMVRGEVPGARINWVIYLARAGMGNATAAALVGLAAGELKANLVGFVGTAAGLKPDDQRHLDVVVANRIHNPYVGKQVSSGSGSVLLGRDKTYAVPSPLIALVSACIADSEWTASNRGSSYSSAHAHAYVAPIVSVEAVQADRDGPVIDEIQRRYQDAAALDMESFGLAAGSDIHDLPVLAVRGLSDFVSDKSKDGNDDLQPRAAGNAASLLRDILAFAHPDDFKRGITPGPAEPPSDRERPSEVALPGATEVWMDRLERRSPNHADAAKSSLAEMRRVGTSAATWLNRALHRPPLWLREDDTGNGWALVSSLAAIGRSRVAWRGFQEAAAVAERSGDMDSSAYFTFAAWLERIARSSDEAEIAQDLTGPGLDEDFGDQVVARLGPVIEFYRAVVGGSLAESKARAEVAIASLGLSDPSGVLRVPEVFVRPVEMDPAIRNLVAATMLRQLAQMMLIPGAADQLGVQSGLAARTLRGNPVTRDLVDDGLRLAQWALELRPKSEGTRLAHAQTMLGVLVSMSGRSSVDVEDEVSKRARLVEADALQVRDVYRDWDGASESALAIAARARSMQGDFTGALRLLLPAPDGIASQREARTPEVVRLGAYLARVTGNDELALELAAKIPDRVEAELMRAAVLGGRPHMADEAKAALFAALELSEGRTHDEFQALIALARRFNSLDDEEQAAIARHITNLRKLDADLADVLQARVLLSQGKSTEALRIVRGLERNDLVLEAHADALVANGRSEEAVQLVFAEGMRRGDIPLAVQGLQIAMDNGVEGTANDIALTLLGREDAKPVRLKVLRALRRIAHNRQNWNEVVLRTKEVMDESAETAIPVPEEEWWQLAEAFYFLERFDKALSALCDAPAISFNVREKAQLFLSILRRWIDETRVPVGMVGADAAGLGNRVVYSMLMRAASEWADDEQIAAAAMTIILMAPQSSFADTQIAEFRDYAEDYFKRHGEAASVKRIKVEEDNLDSLVEFMRDGNSRQQALEKLTHDVRAGKLPLALLTEAAGRTSTESLIRRDLGYVMAVHDDRGVGEAAARAAVGGRVVVDTTALVVGPWTGYPFKKLAAHLDSVTLPAPLREDVARARSTLGMKSTATLGWDSRLQSPVLSEISEEEAQTYADAVEQVWSDIQGLRIATVPESGRRDGWLSGIAVAQDLGVPLWSDDVVMRQLARSMGITAFGSLDLVCALDDSVGVAAAITSMREHKVVDLPILEPWWSLAHSGDWKIDSPLAVAISRPAAWRNIRESFAQFQMAIRLRPPDLDPDRLVAWVHSAANGLALATAPPARPKVVSMLLAWIIFTADSFFTAGEVDDADAHSQAGRVAELVIRSAETIRDQHYVGANALEPIVDVLCRVLLDTVGPEHTSRIIAGLVARLDAEIGTRVFAAYLHSAGR